jgi:hypothetical protein
VLASNADTAAAKRLGITPAAFAARNRAAVRRT